MKLTKLEKFVYENVNNDDSLEELAGQLKRPIRSITAAFNRACRKVAYNISNSLDRFDEIEGR